MKRILSITGFLVIAFFVLSAFSIRESPQDPPRGKKAERHIKMVKKDDKGNKVVLDTILKGDQFFVWQGDTIGGGKDLKWITKDGFKLDSLHENLDLNFEYKIEDDGEGNVFVLKSGKGGDHALHEFKMDDDDMVWKTEKGGEMFFSSPGAPRPPHAPEMMFFGNKKKGNVIDLSDPGIISFKKKVNKNGTEKITIVRKQVDEEDLEQNEEVIIHRNDDVMFMPRNHAAPTSVRVVKSVDGNVEIIENGGTWNIEGDGEKVKVIKEDGKLIRIKEINKDGEKNVEVNVEVKKEKGND